MKLSAMDKAAVNSTASLAPSTASPATPTVVDPEEESVARTETGLADTDPPSFSSTPTYSPSTYSPTLYSPSDRWLHDGIPAYDWSRDDTYDDYTLDYAYGWEDDGDDDPSVDIVY
jgi:hypothetical protein